jgi:hypothetical protein
VRSENITRVVVLATGCAVLGLAVHATDGGLAVAEGGPGPLLNPPNETTNTATGNGSCMTERPWIEEFIACDCHSEGLLFSYMPDVWDGPDDPAFVSVSLWDQWSSKPNWRFRLRCIWRTITKGTPYKDEITLTRQSVERLRHFCEVALADKVYDRPWVVTLRAGEVTMRCGREQH